MKHIEIAYHEAGHLVAFLYFHFNPTSATILKNKNELGSVSHTNKLRPDYTVEEQTEAFEGGIRLKRNKIFDEYDLNERRLKRIGRNMIISLLAGFQAEKRFNPDANIRGSISDYMNASDYVNAAFYLPKKYFNKDSIPDYGQYFSKRFETKTKKFIDEHWDEICFVAKVLLKKKTIYEDEIIRLHLDLKNKFKGFK